MARVGRARPLAVAVALGPTVFAGFLGAVASAETVVDSRNRRVVVARADDADAVTVEALARVSGELGAAGFDIRTLPVNRDADARSTVESIGRELGPVAAFAIFPGPSTAGSVPTAEIWVSDRLTGRATVQRLLVDPRDANRHAAVLAVHAVELLKASLAELWVDDRPRPAGEIARARVAAPAAVAEGRAYLLAGLGFEAAGGVIAHASGLAAGWIPALRVSVGLARQFSARLTVIGAGEVLQLSNPAGTARLRQQIASLDFVTSFRPRRRVQPIASIGAGVYHLGVAGSANAPDFVDRTDQSWAFVGGVGAGVVVGLAEHLAITADVQALGFLPRPVVRLGDAEAGRTGMPALVATGGIVGIF